VAIVFRENMKKIKLLLLLVCVVQYAAIFGQSLRDHGISPGVMNPGEFNAISDVPGVLVGHTTLLVSNEICTGVTAILPHGGNIFQQKVPAAVYVGNGFGKLMGSTQLEELGYLETPIILTNTLSVPDAAAAVIDYVLNQEGNESVRSVNPVVGETNDGFLNDIRGRHIKAEHVLAAIEEAKAGVVQQGSVGAGTGTICFGYKGGIGTSSRKLPGKLAEYTVGVLVQTNFGGDLKIDGFPYARIIREEAESKDKDPSPDGSCMMIVATDAPLDSHQLKRLAKRAVLGLARTGGIASNGSGDYVIAFSTAEELREDYQSREIFTGGLIIRNDLLSSLFQGCVEATEEAILNSLFMATKVQGYMGRTVPLLDVQDVVARMKHGKGDM